MNDIDLSSIANWKPIGKVSDSANKNDVGFFRGTFDGNGHVIKNLTSINNEEISTGLFGDVYNAEIKNLGLKNINISSKGNIGTIAGATLHSTITNCCVTGKITSISNAIGGLIGADYCSQISECSFSGDIISDDCAGGLIGIALSYQALVDTGANPNSDPNSSFAIINRNHSIITDCYSTGIIKTKETAGGLIGIGYNIEAKNIYTSCDVEAQHAGIFISEIHNGSISNIIGNKDVSTTKKEYNSTTGSISNSNIHLLSDSEFHDSSNWSNFSNDKWDKTTYPPTLKNAPKLFGNFNFNKSNEFRIQIGADSDPAANAMYVDTGISMSELEVDLSTTDSCLDAVDCINAALDAVAQKTSDIGVSQSRLETISNVNTTKIENLTAAYSTVTEADVAEEVANYTKSQIMAQTAASLITQTRNFQANLLMRMISSLG